MRFHTASDAENQAVASCQVRKARAASTSVWSAQSHAGMSANVREQTVDRCRPRARLSTYGVANLDDLGHESSREWFFLH